jgi:hypothetical protein
LTLTSDLLVRDKDTLCWVSRLDIEAKDKRSRLLETVLGLKNGDGQLVVTDAIQEPTLVYGFNGTSRLWRLATAGIRRGTVFQVSGTGIAALEQRVAERRWLGERRHEGFGRFRLDALLPGVSTTTASSAGVSWPGQSDDIIAETAQKWCDLVLNSKDAGRRPSSSQWRDFLADLRRDAAKAVADRLTPTTAGGTVWRHKGARKVLEAIGAAANPVRHLEFFVRYWRLQERQDRHQRDAQMAPQAATVGEQK